MGEKQGAFLDSIHKTMSFIFESILAKTSKLSPEPSVLNSSKPPPITIAAYISRFNSHMQCPKEVFVAAMVYVDRAVARNAGLVVTSRNVHRLVAGALVVADKFWCDEFMPNSDYARVAGMRCGDVNAVEREMLRLLDFDMYIGEKEYEDYCRRLKMLKSAKECIIKVIDAIICVSIRFANFAD
eukprot:TRINITY_DN17970_c0_g1_i2.p1 TRINITY_DN17970_c0_g1~~TRINITY_DN17970_c0_g1_i2.p1  ORF type:complete len:184 (-),score=30.77 TRINITY_DN17970_c0_g1_i2:74-625(-)